jgi:hypothetical protein
MGIAAALLTEAGVADRWEEAGVTVAELAEQLLMSARHQDFRRHACRLSGENADRH